MFIITYQIIPPNNSELDGKIFMIFVISDIVVFYFAFSSSSMKRKQQSIIQDVKGEKYQFFSANSTVFYHLLVYVTMMFVFVIYFFTIWRISGVVEVAIIGSTLIFFLILFLVPVFSDLRYRVTLQPESITIRSLVRSKKYLIADIARIGKEKTRKVQNHTLIDSVRIFYTDGHSDEFQGFNRLTPHELDKLRKSFQKIKNIP